MSLKIKDFLLSGPFEIERASVRANQDPVVYVVVEKHGQPWDPKFRCRAIGETGEQGLKFADHPDRAAWTAGASGPVGLYFMTCPRGEGFTAGKRAAVVAEIETAMRASNNDIPIHGAF
jgi:hypothetical protein